MSVDKIRPYNDPRITLRSALLNGYTYGYLHSLPSASTPKRGTVILIHGFPDISMGWRYQIPLLTSLGLEVIALDCLGYGRSDAPPSSHLSAYTFRRIADDVAALCSQLHLESVILGGHDWGGAIVYRIQQYHPTLIRAVFVVCTPYMPPTSTYHPLQTIVDTVIPNFRYQLHLASGQVETAVQSPQEIRQFLRAMYGGRTPDGQFGFVAEKGVLLNNLPSIQPPKSHVITSDELEYYVAEYARHGVNGPLNWYRTRELNFVDEWETFFRDPGHESLSSSPSSRPAAETTDTDKAIKITGCEVLFVQATKDLALKPFMARKMDERIDRLTWKTVAAGHWCLWEKAEECNALIADWLREKVFSSEKEMVAMSSKL